MKRTPLYAEHVALGARMVEFAGWQMPVQYDSIVEEHKRVRTAAGLFDVSHMGEIEISGPDAEKCCQLLFTNDAARLAPGSAHYSLIANEHGGVVDDIIVYRLGAERFLVCVNASNAAKDLAWIRARTEGECVVEDASDRYALLAVQGPAAVRIVAGLAPDAAALSRFGCARLEVGGVGALVARTGYTGEDGFELFVAADRAAALWARLLEAGRPHGLGPAGLGARDTLRLEAALPLYGHELDDDVNPYEVGLGWVVKLNRPEMVGYASLQEASRAREARRLVGLEVQGGIARHGCSVLASDARIGMVTSGSYGPSVEKAIALALVEARTDDTELAVEVRGRRRNARITRLPFYVRPAPTS